MPAPPPPPPMAPAAPPPPMFKISKNSANERDALLNSIRKGAKLKKTVTNDKSAPMIPGAPIKNTKSINNNEKSSNMISPMKNLSSIQMELKKQLANDKEKSSNMISPMKNLSSIQMELKKQLANDNRNRGPPPPAPNRNLSETNFQRQQFSQKENGPIGIHLSQLSLNSNSNLQVNPSTLHRKAKSNANLSTLEISEDINGYQPIKPVINHGKPNLAPKPPVLNGKPFLTPKTSSRPSLGRAHSMKSAPRSPSPQSPVDTVNPAIKFGTVRHMSSIIGQSLVHSGQQPRSRPALNGRPSAPPPSIPQQPPTFSIHSPSPSQPPPPPSKISVVKHPNHAPPPPPPISTIPQAPPHAPPPPPHKTQTPRPPIPLPTAINNNAINPPPPPPRHSSMRENPSLSNVAVNLEEKFKHMFEPADKFPQPPPYKNIIKLYNYKPVQKSGYVV